jgi:hypothetical protein
MIISDAYSAVVSSQFNESISSVTLESLAQEQIEQIEGKDGITAIRPNRLTEIDRIVNELTTAVELAKSMDPRYFQINADDRGRIDDVANTPIE